MKNIPEEVKTQIKEAVDIESLLMCLGFKVTKSSNSEVRAPCIIHGGDNPTGFSIRTETRKWKCFTGRCEVNGEGRAENDLVALVMRTQNLSFIDALQFLSDFSGLHIDVRSNDFVEDEGYKYKRDASRFVKMASRILRPTRPPSMLSEAQQAAYIVNRDDYFVQQGFHPETLETFQIGGLWDRSGVKRATIPIHDDGGNLVGLSARRTDNDDEPRYEIEYKFQKGKVLYNLHNAKQYGSDLIIIVEGFKACWAVHEAGFPNVAACMGSVITEDQVSLLVSSQFMRCVLLLDGDESGRDGTERSVPKIERALKVIPAYLPDNISPDSISRDELRDFLNIHMC